MLATNFGSLCPKVTNFGSQNFGSQIWFCTRLIKIRPVTMEICQISRAFSDSLSTDPCKYSVFKVWLKCVLLCIFWGREIIWLECTQTCWLPAWWALWLLWWPLTDAAMFQCVYGYLQSVFFFLVLFHCCILLEIKLTTTTTTCFLRNKTLLNKFSYQVQMAKAMLQLHVCV